MAEEKKFTDAEMAEYKKVFASFDTDSSGAIDGNEITQALKNLKIYKNEDQVRGLIAEVDKNKNGQIEFAEFLDILYNAKMNTNTNSAFIKVYTKQKDLIKVQGHSGTHSYAEEEMAAFAEHISQLLSNDPECKVYLPIEPTNLDLCLKVGDGVVLAKFINIAVRDTIDERALNKRKGAQQLSPFQINENLNLVIKASVSIGVKVTNIGASEITNGRNYPHIVLGLVWQLVKIQLLNSINLKNHPELIRLLEEGEELRDLLKLPPDQLLLRWFNYHLKRANHKKINNLAGDLKDSYAYTTLLNQLAPNTCGLQALNESDMTKRAKSVLDNASKLDVKAFIKPSDIVSGNPRLNLAFTAAIFNQCPGLDPPTEEEVKKAGLLEDDFGDSREERAFRMWINSLGIEDLYVNSLYEDCKDGLVLLKVMDKIEPGIVDWKTRVEKVPDNKFKKLTNDNYAIILGKQLKFSLVNIAGADILDGNKKLLLACVWQLMRYHTLKFLAAARAKQFGDGTAVTDDMIVQWANKRVADAGKSTSIRSFQDPALSTGLFLMDLLFAINNNIIDWNFVTPGASVGEKTANAKYVISVARKLGATIFLLPEDIVEVKPKMILTFIAACMAISK